MLMVKMINSKNQVTPEVKARARHLLSGGILLALLGVGSEIVYGYLSPFLLLAAVVVLAIFAKTISPSSRFKLAITLTTISYVVAGILAQTSMSGDLGSTTVSFAIKYMNFFVLLLSAAVAAMAIGRGMWRSVGSVLIILVDLYGLLSIILFFAAVSLI